MYIYLEECVFSPLECVCLLSIVDEDGGVVDDWHLREALLGVEEHVEHGDDAHAHEATNHHVVLLHSGALLTLGTLQHSYNTHIHK